MIALAFMAFAGAALAPLSPAKAAPTSAEPAEPAGNPTGPLSPPVELRHDLRVDVPLVVALAGSLLAVHLVRDDLQPGACRWCDGAPSDLNGVDDAFRSGFRRTDTEPARVTSHVLAFAATPIMLGGLTALASVVDRRGEDAVTDLVLAAEGSLAALVVAETLSPIILRQRPAAHALADPEAHARAVSDPSALRSFPSGHASAVFGITAAAGTIATMRGYRIAPLVWASGLLLGIATSYTRIAADESYLTDALGGLAIGTIVGAGLPLLVHRPHTPRGEHGLFRGMTITSSAVPGGRVVGVGGAF